ncbi:MAG: cobalamin biosynthesis protein CbiX [Opitutaceae bacterium]|nr:cobalamin biosynthesis protein CbiX [Opitutaceae bacterium]
MFQPERCFLFDNGSLRPAATLSLRTLGARLEKRIGCPVAPVSLLHSNAVSPGDLQGRAADLLEPALKAALADGIRSVGLLPLFFGPSNAIIDYLPKRLRSVAASFPEATHRLARWVVDTERPGDCRIASLLAQRVRALLKPGAASAGARVVLVDHGSPQSEVTAIRDHLGKQLAHILKGEVPGVHVASMERRPGLRYAFNEPLLIDRLTTPPCDSGDLILALQFFSSGRHAGSEGDIESICNEARQRCPALRVHVTEPLGHAEELIDVLADRFDEMCQAPGPPGKA